MSDVQDRHLAPVSEVPDGAILPFSLSIDPRERLLLFDIADDPDYAALEIQVFDDEVHGRGTLVLLQRQDRTVDIYHDPGLRLDRTAFSVGRGIGEWRETTIEPARLLIADDGVEVDVGMTDAAGRRIEVEIDDRDGRTRRRASLLAPVGSGVEQPRSLFVVLMRGFDLGRTSGQEPRLRIGGEERHLVAFPGPPSLHGRRFIRYSSDPIIVVVNPAHDGPVAAVAPGAGIRELRAGSGERGAALLFDPPFPDLRSMGVEAEASGTWTLDVADEPGLTGGTWTARRRGDAAELAMAVTRPWTPRHLPLSLQVVTTIAPVFRRWPTTYRWSARVDLRTDPPTMTSSWTRTAGPDRENAYQVRRIPLRPFAAGLALVAAVVLLRRRSLDRG